MNERGARLFRLAVLLLTVALLAARPPVTDVPRAVDDPTRLLSAPATGFARAAMPRAFAFPRDHAPHPDYQTEWWYFTGHLADADGREFGFQLTFFRFELATDQPPSTSAWRTPRVWLGHFAVSDFAARRFHAHERLARAHPALAAVTEQPLHLRLDDWEITYQGEAARAVRAADDRWALRAHTAEAALELTLVSPTPPVLQGSAGLSRKSTAPGNASYYYSLPRLAAEGQLRLGSRTFAVTGSAWLDREWSTSALAPALAGWDWFALQLDDGSNLMFYQLRQSDGTPAAESAGSLVAPDGTVEALTVDAVTLDVSAWWRSPHSGRRYPHRWRLRVPARGLDLVLTPRLADQEWRGRFRYWEGAVAVTGSHSGRGYVELTGY